MNASASVLFNTLKTAGSTKVGVATLNRPDSLNALSLDMCQLLYEQLQAWQSDPSIAFVALRGQGDRAFCAGGDLRGLYETIVGNRGGNGWDNAYARTFFEVEYRLDLLIHRYPKPVLCWGSGVVMGGGVGLMMGASHRVVTETTRFAMPEISIGLFPDVGGSWMLSHMPDGIGNFLALSGAHLGASDCRVFGLADYWLESSLWPILCRAIEQQVWPDQRREVDVRLHRMVKDLQKPADGYPGPLQSHAAMIQELCGGPDLDLICRNIAGLSEADDPWLQRAGETLRRGSPGSARLAFTLMNRARRRSLASAFRHEYIAALQCCAQGDLQEGIRALIIDKDRAPKWNPAEQGAATSDWVQRFLTPPWPAGQPHPLADLGED